MFFSHIGLFQAACSRCRLMVRHNVYSFFLNKEGKCADESVLPKSLASPDGYPLPCVMSAHSNNDRNAHEVGVFKVDNGWLAVWDPVGEEAKRTLFHVGSKGQYLQMAYLIEAAQAVGTGHGLFCRDTVTKSKVIIEMFERYAGYDLGVTPDVAVHIHIPSLFAEVVVTNPYLRDLDCIKHSFTKLASTCCSREIWIEGNRFSTNPKERHEEAMPR